MRRLIGGILAVIVFVIGIVALMRFLGDGGAKTIMNVGSDLGSMIQISPPNTPSFEDAQ